MKKPDWVAWSLQGLLGFAVGGILGFVFLIKTASGSRGNLIADSQKSLFLLGIALAGFGIASLLGDRLWMQDSYRNLAPDDPSHSIATKLISVIASLLGCVLVLTSIFRG